MSTVRTRVLTGLVLVLSFAPGCEKKTTSTPEPTGEVVADADAVRWFSGSRVDQEDPGQPSDPGQSNGEWQAGAKVTLNVTVKGKIETSGDLNGGMTTSVRGKLTVEPFEGDRLLSRAVVEAVDGLEERGEFKDPKKDLAARVTELVGDDYVAVLDRFGDTDVEATKNLPENKTARESAEKEAEEARKKREAEGKEDEPPRPQLGVAHFIFLPRLPFVSLPPGETKSLERQKDTASLFGVIDVPVERDYEMALVSVDQSNGKELAEYRFAIEGQGATEIEAQGGNTALVSMLEESEVVVVVDRKSGLPVSATGFSATEITFAFQGRTQRVESHSEFEAAYTLAEAAATEPAAPASESEAPATEPAADPAPASEAKSAK